MKCRLKDKERCDTNFQIEFKSIDEIESLAKELKAMAKYFKKCKRDGEEIPDLIYRIE